MRLTRTERSAQTSKSSKKAEVPGLTSPAHGHLQLDTWQLSRLHAGAGAYSDVMPKDVSALRDVSLWAIDPASNLDISGRR